MRFSNLIVTFLTTSLLITPAFAKGNAHQAKVDDKPSLTQAAQETNHLLNLNEASIKDLTKIKGITKSRAKAIVMFRHKNGPFASVTDLSKVKGFKKIKVDKLKAIEKQLST